MVPQYDNEDPTINVSSTPTYHLEVDEDNKLVNVNKESIFQLIRNIKDPEHPLTLEQLNVVSIEDIEVFDNTDETIKCQLGLPIPTIRISILPTVPHCSMVGIIGLSILYKLRRYVDTHWLQVMIKENSHSQDKVYNKQLSDNDRVNAAFENTALLEILDECVNFC